MTFIYTNAHRATYVLLIFLLISCSTKVNMNTTSAEWKEDIRSMSEQMPAEHLNLFKKMKKSTFENAISDLEKNIDNFALIKYS